MRGLASRTTLVGIIHVVLLTSPKLLAWQSAKGCGSTRFEQKLNRKEIENLQRWVDDGHEPWRMDAPQLVANQKLLELAASVKGVGPHQTSPQQIVRRPDYAVLVYQSVVGKRTYRVTLRKFHWLVGVAGRLDWVIWVATQVDLVDCP